MQNCNALCSVSESNKQNPQDRTLDLPFFCRYKHIPSLKNLPSPAPNESLPTDAIVLQNLPLFACRDNMAMNTLLVVISNFLVINLTLYLNYHFISI